MTLEMMTLDKIQNWTIVICIVMLLLIATTISLSVGKSGVGVVISDSYNKPITYNLESSTHVQLVVDGVIAYEHKPE